MGYCPPALTCAFVPPERCGTGGCGSKAGGASLTLAIPHTSLHSLTQDPAPIFQVGIEDCLHIEFEYDRTRYALGDVVTGRVHFLLVRIRIKFMELAVIRKESVSGGSKWVDYSAVGGRSSSMLVIMIFRWLLGMHCR